MTHDQHDAWMKALYLVTQVPNVTWCFCITDQDVGGAGGNASLNIYITPDGWHMLRLLYGLGTPDDHDATFESWDIGSLTLSFINPEATDVE